MESRIAILPIGYADGYSRKLSNQGQVLVRGRRVPVIGRVCMDYIIADVTGIPGVSLGDEAVLMGRQGREVITAEEMGERIGTISYEIFCLVGKRVPRVYKE
jgi:alanine racemase